MKPLVRRSIVACALAPLLMGVTPAAYPSATGSRSSNSPDHRADATRHAPPPSTPAVAAQPQPLVLGSGSRPGLAVDVVGTGYLAWNGPENPTSLQFCRLPRGASTCATRTTIAVPAGTTSGSRPFLFVSGSGVRVLQYRYPASGTTPAGLYAFTSTTSGATFAAGVMVGTVAVEEGVMGPGDTFSGVPVNTEMAFQSVPLGGGAAADKAVLSTTHQNQAAVGLVDAATPLAVFTQDTAAQWRRYAGSGSLNDSANWTPALDVGVASYPKLAGGPSGLFLLAGDGAASLNVRRWNGSGFGPSTTVGPGSSPTSHLTQDAAGRLHAVFQRDSADPLQLIHAVSDDGVHWRSGTLVTQEIATDGGIQDVRVAVAPDHIGLAVWHAGLAAGDVRVTPVGPDAPADVSFAASPKKRRVSNKGSFKYSFAVGAPGSGKISLTSTKKVKLGSRKTRLKIPGKVYTAAEPGKVGIKLKFSPRSLRALEHVKKLRFEVTVTFGSGRFTTTVKMRAP
jgi:hypothetical protein